MDPYYSACLGNLVAPAVLVATSGELGRMSAVFSPFGCANIALWGLAYAAAVPAKRRAPLLSLLFAAEKALFVGAWVVHVRSRGVAGLVADVEHSFLAGMLLAVFGVFDLFYAVVFLRTGLAALSGKRRTS